MVYNFHIKKIIDLLLKLLLVVLMVALLALAGALYWLSSESGKAFVQDQTENQLSKSLGYKVRAQGVSFHLPLIAKIEQVSLLDAQGVWLKTNDLSISFLPTFNIKKHLIFRKIAANKLVVSRIPEINISNTKGTGNLDISVQKINIDELIITNAITQLKEDLISSFMGSVNWLSSSKKVAFETLITAKKPVLGFQEISLNSTGSFLLSEDLFTLTSMSLSSPNLNISGNGTLNISTNALTATICTDKMDVSNWRKNMSGVLQADAIISGTIQSPIIKTTLHLHDAMYLKQTIPDITTNIISKKDAQKWSGDINIILSEHDKATMQYEWIDNILKLDSISGKYLNNKLKGSLFIDRKTAIMEGKLYAQIPSIEKFHNYIPNSFYGSAEIFVKLSSRKIKQAQAASVRLNFKNIALEQVRASSMQTQIEFDDLWDSIPNFIKITSSNIFFNNIFADKASFILFRDNNKWTARIDATGGSLKQFHISSVGDINFISKNNWYFKIASLQGYYQNIPFSSKTKITTQKQEDKFILTMPDLVIGRGRCSMDIKQKNEVINVTVKGKDIPLQELWKDKSEIFSNSRANINLNISGDVQSSKLELQTDFINMKLNSSPQLSHIKSHVILHNGKAIINAIIMENSKINSRIDLNLPAHFSLNPIKLSLDKTMPIEGTVNMALNSSKLLELFLSPEHSVKSDIKGKIKISGNLNSPQFLGNISLKNGSYNYLPMQINLNKTTLLLNFNNRSINLTNFHAEDAKGNKIISKGKVSFTNFRQYEYNLNFATKNFELLNHPRVYGIISGNITVAGNDKAGKISGVLQSNLIEIRLPERIIQNIPELNIVATIPNNYFQQTTRGYTRKPYIMALNIGVKADRKVFIRGWGLDVELQGQLSLRGTTSDPEISGKFNSIRGRYEEFGKKLYLKKAELLFEGRVPPSPFLNIIGSITQSDVEIKVILTGSVKNPLLRIESIPIMPQEDVLSILLFGKTTAKITPIQVIQLAASIKKLLGKGGGTIDPLDKIRNLFGVDNISVTNSTVNDDTTIGIGKYIGNKVYFEVEKGIQAGSEKAHVEIEISPHIFIESDTSTTSESNLGINWKYEY